MKWWIWFVGIIVLGLLVLGLLALRQVEKTNDARISSDQLNIIKLAETTKIEVDDFDLKEARGYLITYNDNKQVVVICNSLGCWRLKVTGWVESKAK